MEGYTNFLWVLVVAAGLALGLDPEPVANGLGVLSSLVVLVAVTVAFARRHGAGHPLVLAPALLLATTRSFTAWSTGGLATTFFAALLWLGFDAWSREREDEPARAGRSSLWLAAATLTRPEGGLVTAVVGCAYLVDVVRGRRPWRALLGWCLPWWGIVGAHLAFRVAYYGDVVPNTFHAKVNGAWVEQGLRYLELFHLDYGAGWWIGLAVVGVAARRDAHTATLGAVLATFTAYLLYVGGDRFGLRFLVFVFPMLYSLVAEGIAALAARAGARGPLLGWALVAAISGWAFTHSHQPTPPIRKQVESVQWIGNFAQRRAMQGRFLRALVDDGRLPEDLRLCVGAAGALPYHARLWALDYFGLTDPRVRDEQVEGRRVIVAHEHAASPTYVQEHAVQLYDAVGWLVTDELRLARRAWTKTVDKLRRIDPGGAVYRPVCHEVDGHYLVFATTVSAAEHARVFGDFPSCEDRLSP